MSNRRIILRSLVLEEEQNQKLKIEQESQFQSISEENKIEEVAILVEENVEETEGKTKKKPFFKKKKEDVNPL